MAMESQGRAKVTSVFDGVSWLNPLTLHGYFTGLAVWANCANCRGCGAFLWIMPVEAG